MADDRLFMINGVTVGAPPESLSSALVDALSLGLYEATEARLLPPIIQPGERIVELGGGLGYVSIVALRTGRVESLTTFEANPALADVIARNAARNGVELTVRNAVVATKPEGASAPFFLRSDFWASSLSPTPYGYANCIEVPTVRFADVLFEQRPTMLIVDIEGGEEMLFRDLPLTGVKKIFVELHQNVIGRTGMKNVFDFMSAKDFHYDQHHSQHGVVLFSHVLR